MAAMLGLVATYQSLGLSGRFTRTFLDIALVQSLRFVVVLLVFSIGPICTKGVFAAQSAMLCYIGNITLIEQNEHWYKWKNSDRSRDLH
jgi:hypothetical protein